MAKKTRKQKQRAASRRPGPTIPGGAGLAVQPVDGVDAVDSEPSETPAEPLDGVLTAAAGPPEPAPQEVASRPAPPPASGTRRRIERLHTPAVPVVPRSSRIPTNAASMFAPLESDDAAIPFDRVPYVRADLRRVAIMAAMMVGLIIIAAIIVSHVVK